METLKSLFMRPDPNEEMRKMSLSLRSQLRSLDRTIVSSNQAQAKAKSLIVQADKRAKRDPTRARQAAAEVRDMAREVVRIRRSISRTTTIKAQVNSTLMKVQEAQAMRKVTDSINVGARVMKQMGVLAKLPETRAEAMRFMAEYEKNAVGAEMADEIMDDMLEDPLDDGEDIGIGEGEVDQVLAEVLRTTGQAQGQGQAQTAVPGRTTADMLPAAPGQAVAMEEEEEEDNEAMMDQMRNRLEALRG